MISLLGVYSLTLFISISCVVARTFRQDRHVVVAIQTPSGNLIVRGQDVPPRYSPYYWCETPELSAAVGVSQQCEAYNKTVWNEKVTLTLLWQTHCGVCAEFISTILYPLLYPKFELVVFGDGDYGVVESCGIHYIQNVETRLSFISCLEAAGEAPPVADHLKTCLYNAAVSQSDADKINTCWTTDEGGKLMAQNAKRADGAWPEPIKYIPWIFINNASTLQSQNALPDYDHPSEVVAALTMLICNAYEGPSTGPITRVCGGAAERKQKL